MTPTKKTTTTRKTKSKQPAGSNVRVKASAPKKVVPLDSLPQHPFVHEVLELKEYIKGGRDSEHQQLREAYGHISKPQARKIMNYLGSILEDAVRYQHDRRPGRRKKGSK